MRKILFSVLAVSIIGLPAIWLSRAEVDPEDLTGRWVIDRVAESYLVRNGIDGSRFVSWVMLNKDGSFEAFQMPQTGSDPPWTGRGRWSFETELTPRLDGNLMVHLSGRNGSQDVDCWIDVKRSMVGDIRLVWKFDVLDRYEIEYLK